LQAQRAEGLGILLITTDLDEVLALSDRCYVIYRGRLTETPLDREQIGLAMGGARVAAAGGGEGA
jgi:simple sugar transport system ATP-binding protein